MRTEEEKREFEINLEDLWSFERREFKKNGLSTDFWEEVIDKMSSLVVEQTEPFVEKQMEGEEHYTYWKSKQAEYRISLDKNNPFDSDLIYSGKAFYTHYSNVKVKSSTENFDIWFALKLRQFDRQLIDLPKYLEYHLSESFNSDLTKYTRFLTLLIRQFKEEVLSEKVVLTVNEWLEYFTPMDENLKSSPTVKPRKVERTVSGKYDSFLFDSSNEKITEFDAIPNNWAELSIKLKEGKFISKDVKSTNLKKVFHNRKLEKDSRIIWAGTNKELQWFIHYFVKDKTLVENPGNDIWLITIKCFTKEDGSEYSINKLSSASGNNTKRKELLYSILDQSFDL